MAGTEIKELSSRHQQMARLLVGGHSQAEIGRMLGMHKSTVSRLMKDPAIVREVKRLQEMADVNSTTCVPGIPEKISEGAYKAIQVLQDILNDERNDPDMLKVKSNVALELLSRAGFGPKKQVNIQEASVSAHFTSEDIEEIKRRARQARPELLDSVESQED